MVEESTGSARVHWLVVGELGGVSEPARVALSAATLAEVLEARRLEVEVDLGEAFGRLRRGAVRFAKLRDFSLQGVLSACAGLAPLAELVQKLAATDPAQRPGRAEVLQRLESAYGPTALMELVDKAWPQAVPAAPASPSGPARAEPGLPSPLAQSSLRAPLAPSGSLLDEMLSGGAAQSERSASSAVDALVRAVRGAPPVDAGGTRAAHRTLEQALFEAAARALRHPEVQRLEGHWRGLKMLLDELKQGSSMAVELISAGPAERAARIEEAMAQEAIERPDAIFVVDALQEVGAIEALADLAEGLSIPVVCEVSPRFFGADDAATAARQIDDGAPPPAGLSELRLEPRARWLCAAMNRVRVVAEGSGVAKRSVSAPAALGVAALLAAAYRASGAFVRMTRPEGGLKAPAVDTLSSGPGSGTACPTEAFVASSAQSTLARAGVLALGSAKNNDILRLSRAPMLSSAADAVELPAQILAGRVVRFSQWIRDQIPTGSTPEEVSTLFEQAAGAFLFPGQSEMAAVSAQVVEAEGKKHLTITANIRPELAGTFLKLAFALPI